MNNVKKLVNNSIIFAIGNVGSKLINIIMIPLYTYYLTPEDYGIFDLLVSASALMVPLISLSIAEGAFRFTLDKSQNKNNIFSSSFFILFLGSIIMISLYPIMNNIRILSGRVFIFDLMVITSAFRALGAAMTRGLNKIKQYALNGIYMTIITANLNILFLMKLSLGLKGYILALVIGNTVSIFHFAYSCRLDKYIRIRYVDIDTITLMLKYTIPIIPTEIIFWVTNTSNRYFLLYFSGVTINGLYAVANKLPSIIGVGHWMFVQAYQIFAVEEYESKNKSIVYTQAFNTYSIFMYFVGFSLLVVTKPIFTYFISNSYFEAWKLTPILYLAFIFSGFAGFYATNYMASGKTKGLFTSSSISMIVNIVLNIILIPLIGGYGAAFSTCISFLITWLIRIKDTKDIVPGMKILWMTHIAAWIIFALGILVIYLNLGIFIESSLLLMLIVIYLFYNKNTIKKLFSKII